ncbi:cytochrome b/b6 domain-containing protein [Sphingomonas sp. G-3-2-10]|uniref:cytochrome b/b6 domain-containing protein n=1 Tax=Sphingomonas sp. G-3-2-10 TaxID=2728838 RepID=UPI00146EF2FA|nr:cytochrome b/b6 domain-containing protein [Sphingomonas sp. G-3-2-10]NML05815.1 Ni/Fe-hydrogenase 1 b-type cytochrome subunit [Sphingomonas sp. G-3-2-10]
MKLKSPRQYVWDVPTRLFHWLLVGLIGFSWWSAEMRYMDWHLLSGLTVCALLLFRILWGVFGTATARFSQFVKGPRAIAAYLRSSDAETPVGHNPLGALSVIALLLVLAAMVITGLFAVDIDGIDSGPLSYLVDFDQGRVAADIHHLSFTALQILVVLHVLAILFYLIARRRNLTWTMITGSEPLGEGEGRVVARVHPWRLLVAVAVAGGVAWWIAGGAQL